MTREQKIEKRKQRNYERKRKRIEKDRSYIHTAYINDRVSISWGRRRQQGRVHVCDMGWTSCESRGYCNGDC